MILAFCGFLKIEILYMPTEIKDELKKHIIISFKHNFDKISKYYNYVKYYVFAILFICYICSIIYIM